MRFDPLLVRRLADELNERLRGRGCAAAPFFAADRSVTLPLQGRLELRADLHPTRGFFRILPAADPEESDLDAVVEEVTAPPDERLIEIRLREENRFRSGTRALVFELATNQWNAILRGEDGRIVSLLNARRSGERSLHAGAEYLTPPREERFGVSEVPREEARALWETEIVAAPSEERGRRLMARFAWTGAVNGPWILGEQVGGPPAAPSASASSGSFLEDPARGRASGIGDPRPDVPDGFDADAAFERWWWIRGLPTPRPVVLRLGRRSQPYPVALAGVQAERFPSLLDAMAHLAGLADEASVTSEAGRLEANTARAAAFAAARVAAARRRLERLRDELADAAGADEFRERGDLLLARISRVRRGDPIARLEDWAGGVVQFEIDPLLTPSENAAKLYEEARRRERAAERLPGMITEAETEESKWLAAAGEIETGRIPEWVAERLARRAIPAGTGSGGDGRSGKGSASRGTKGAPGSSLPYRVFRTSGGLEVWVGRGAKENDRLTFREAAPNDVWLHVQAMPGSHVVLRWSDPTAAPPARDLEEAAQLAAVFSRARTSSVAAVVWTRRKHVRKPRGAPPGTVVPQQVKTLFVEPDESVKERLTVRE